MLRLTELERRECPAAVATAGGQFQLGGEAEAPFGAGYTGPLTLAVADVTSDGVPDLIVGAGYGGGPRVKVYDGRTRGVLADFLAYEDTFRGGVAVGFDPDTHAVLTGAGPGGAPRVNAYDPRTFALTDSYFVGPPDTRTGTALTPQPWAVKVYESVPDVVTRTPSDGGPPLKVWVNWRGNATQGQILETMRLLPVLFAGVPNLEFHTRRPEGGRVVQIDVVNDVGGLPGVGDAAGSAMPSGWLYPRPVSGQAEVRDTAAAMASIIAHEMGHLLGLNHLPRSPVFAGHVMLDSASPANTVFTADETDRLRAAVTVSTSLH